MVLSNELAAVAFLPKNGRYRGSRRFARGLDPDAPSCPVGRRNCMGVAQGHAQILPSLGISHLRETLKSDDPVAISLRESARRMVGIAVFSGVINVLMLSGSLYMLQV